jgi:sec1 family domain-containing protein 1
VAALPAVSERKRLVDMHMNIATVLMGAIKARHLDEYHAVEAAIARQVRLCT